MIGLIFGETNFPKKILNKVKKKKLKYLIIDLKKNKFFKKNRNSHTVSIGQFGKIINIASIFGVISKEKRAAYSSTKWGLIGFTKAVALELAPFNIQVNAVSPGFVDTDLTRKILGLENMKQLEETIPQGRLANPDEIANVVLFLCSSQNTYITGQNIVVDGGFTSV